MDLSFGPQSADRPFPWVLLRLHHAPKPGRFGKITAENQCQTQPDPRPQECPWFNPEENSHLAQGLRPKDPPNVVIRCCQIPSGYWALWSHSHNPEGIWQQRMTT